jgi:hypothetical protein
VWGGATRGGCETEHLRVRPPKALGQHTARDATVDLGCLGQLGRLDNRAVDNVCSRHVLVTVATLERVPKLAEQVVVLDKPAWATSSVAGHGCVHGVVEVLLVAAEVR